MTQKLIAENRRARFDYFLEQTFEAGLILTGTEVKALRMGRANIAESYASAEDGTIVLINAYIPEYGPANRFNHEPRRPRKLLLHRKEIDKLTGAIQREGRTLIPTRLYFNDKGMAKLVEAAPRHVDSVRKIFIDAVTPEDFEAIGRAMSAVLAVEFDEES